MPDGATNHERPESLLLLFLQVGVVHALQKLELPESVVSDRVESLD